MEPSFYDRCMEWLTVAFATGCVIAFLGFVIALLWHLFLVT